MGGNDFIFSMAETDDGSAVFITLKNTREKEWEVNQGFKDKQMNVLDSILEKT